MLRLEAAVGVTVDHARGDQRQDVGVVTVGEGVRRAAQGEELRRGLAEVQTGDAISALLIRRAQAELRCLGNGRLRPGIAGDVLQIAVRDQQELQRLRPGQGPWRSQ